LKVLAIRQFAQNVNKNSAGSVSKLLKDMNTLKIVYSGIAK
jgi:hypothetical protein